MVFFENHPLLTGLKPATWPHSFKPPSNHAGGAIDSVVTYFRVNIFVLKNLVKYKKYVSIFLLGAQKSSGCSRNRLYYNGNERLLFTPIPELSNSKYGKPFTFRLIRVDYKYKIVNKQVKHFLDKNHATDLHSEKLVLVSPVDILISFERTY